VTEAEIGLIDGTTYQSPQFGYRISWDDGWSADTTSMESNPGISLDRLSIVSGSARFQAFYVAAEGESASEYAERFINFRTSGDPTMRIVTSGDRRGVVWIAYAMESQGSEALGVVEISLVGDGAIMQVIEVIDRSPTFGSAFDSAMASILVEGEPPFRILAGWPG
jgi:hypothetical protein